MPGVQLVGRVQGVAVGLERDLVEGREDQAAVAADPLGRLVRQLAAEEERAVCIERSELC